MNRRAAFMDLVAKAKAVPPCPWPRPPGAAEEAEFQQLCTHCDDCIVACPHGAIGRLTDGTPAVDPNKAPCHLCDDMPCAAACTTGALVTVPWDAVFFGFAEISKARCFVFQGPECGACAPACPTKALRMVAGKPSIDDADCNGCGLCREACPIYDPAIRVVV